MLFGSEKKIKSWDLFLDEDDKQIERELPASNEDGVAAAPLSKYSISVKTGDVRGAGTGNYFLPFSGYSLPEKNYLANDTNIDSWQILI